MARFGALSFVFLLLFCGSFGDFPSDYLENYLSDDKYDNRTLCWTKVCMEDSGRLIYAADHNSNKTAPCDDFKTFAMGEFYKHRVLNDRYAGIGFFLDVILQYAEKQKKILLKPIKPADPEMFKVIKRFFQQCINFAYVEKQGLNDVVALGQSLGIVPISLEDNAERLEATKAMHYLPRLTFLLFFDREIAFCKNGTIEVLCLDKVGKSDFIEYSESLTDVVRQLKLSKSYKTRIEEDFKLYLKKRKSQQLSTQFDETVIMEIEEINEKFPSKHFDWLNMINNQLLSNSQVTLYDKILIRDPQSLERLFKLFAELDDTLISNVIATALFARNQHSFMAHPFSTFQAHEEGSKRAAQRHEQCLVVLEDFAPLAMESLMAVNLHDQSVQSSATELVELAVADVIDEISKNGKIPNATQDKVTNKLKSVKLSVMFPDDILNLTKVDGLYNELEFKGNESFPELYTKLWLHGHKLSIKPRDHWIKKLNTIVTEVGIRYFADMNILNVPAIFTLYPYFHPNRSRFFNMATLYKRVVSKVTGTLLNTFPSSDLRFINTDFETMAYKSYVRWEENGGIERQLPSFKLTNRQMLWLCMVHAQTKKTHDDEDLFEFDLLRLRPGFREAYQCGELTEDEKLEQEEFGLK